MSPFPLPPFGGPGWGDFGWTILLAAVAAVVVFAIMELARWAKRVVDQRPFLLTIAAGLCVGGLAIAFAETTGESPDAVLFSGEESFGTLFGQATTVSLSTLSLLLLFKGLAWSISLGNFRGGPTFPAIFLGVVAGLMAQHLPGYAETQAVAALMGAACVAVLRLPLSSVMIASLLSAKAGLAVTPLIVVAVVVAYLTSEALTAFVDTRVGAAARRRGIAEAPVAAVHPQRMMNAGRTRSSLRAGGEHLRRSILRINRRRAGWLRHRPTYSSRATRTSTGDERLRCARALVKDKQVSIEGAILVTHAEDGSVAVQQTGDNLGRKGRAGARCRARGRPLRAAAARVGCRRGGGGRLVGKFADHRVENEIHDKIGENLPPGSAGIIAIFDDEQRLGVEQALSGAMLRSVAQGDKKGTAALKESLAEAMGKFSRDRSAADPDPNFGGTIGRTIDASVADWTINMTPSTPEGAPTSCSS